LIQEPKYRVPIVRPIATTPKLLRCLRGEIIQNFRIQEFRASWAHPYDTKKALPTILLKLPYVIEPRPLVTFTPKNVSFAYPQHNAARLPIAWRTNSVSQHERIKHMPVITTKDGTEIFYKDWGSGQPIVFSHGWPLSADDWDAQMLFFLGKGFRVVAHDRRGHGRSSQTGGGHDMDHYADDLAALTAHLDLKDAVHVGHSTGGGEVVHYIARHGESRVAKAAIISAVPPLMVKTQANPGGLPKDVFDGLQAQLAASRSQFYYDLPAGPFYGYNRPGAKVSQPVIWNWWRQGMMGGAKAHYDGIVAFSQTDFTEDLKKITVPVLVMHGDDDQIVPYADSAPLSAKLLKNGTLKTYKGFPHGMPTTQAETINADLLAFIKGL
jgi:non-heme chloroperoxidase